MTQNYTPIEIQSSWILIEFSLNFGYIYIYIYVYVYLYVERYNRRKKTWNAVWLKAYIHNKRSLMATSLLKCYFTMNSK